MEATTAVILAGGLGTRMRPLTDRRPKPALLVAGVPIVGRQLRRLADAGITDVRVVTSYRADQLRALVGDGSSYGVNVRYLHEPSPLGTGGALALAARSVDAGRNLVVVNGDQLSQHDLTGQLRAFEDSDAAVTLHARHEPDARPFGLLQVAGDQVSAFQEKPAEAVAGLVNAGTYVMRAGVVAGLPSDAVISLERDVFPELITTGHALRTYVDNSYSIDVGSPAALLRASLDVVQHRGLTALVEGDVAADARIDGHSWVGPEATVAAGAVVHRCVIMPGAAVGSAADAVDSVVAQGATVGDGVRLQHSVIGEGAVIRRSPAPGEIVPTDAVVG